MVLFAISVIIFCIIFCIDNLIEKKYTNFVLENSLSLKELENINQRYKFFPDINLDQKYIYDNQNFYEETSCTDFLIYQLQYIEQDISAQIKKVNINKEKYLKYLEEVNCIEGGQFHNPVKRLKVDRLIEKEKLLIKEYTLKPITEFSLTVILCCSKINGEVYARKRESFSSDEIVLLLKRLKNKKGSFFNDRDIWDAICRVERGKVSNKMRFLIYKRDGYKCRYCGISENYATLEIDHIIPISKGGKSVYDNLQTLCHKCNYEKSDKTY